MIDEKPKDISELDYFTRQILEPNGFVFMWVYKPKCPKCNKGRLTKLKKRDKVYTCPSCNSTFSKEEYNGMLYFNIEYTCPECGFKGQLHDKWNKPSKSAAVMLKFKCEKCGASLKVVRMKKKKK